MPVCCIVIYLLQTPRSPPRACALTATARAFFWICHFVCVLGYPGRLRALPKASLPVVRCTNSTDDVATWIAVPDPGPLTSGALSLRWKDQGWGNQKGLVYVRRAGFAWAKLSPTFAPHEVTDATFPLPPAVLAGPGALELGYLVGGGGGHELHVLTAELSLNAKANKADGGAAPELMADALLRLVVDHARCDYAEVAVPTDDCLVGVATATALARLTGKDEDAAFWGGADPVLAAISGKALGKLREVVIAGPPGLADVHAKLMGTYKEVPGKLVNGAATFTTADGCFLFVSKNSGMWVLTDDVASVPENKGFLRLKSGPNGPTLPVEEFKGGSWSMHSAAFTVTVQRIGALAKTAEAPAQAAAGAVAGAAGPCPISAADGTALLVRPSRPDASSSELKKLIKDALGKVCKQWEKAGFSGESQYNSSVDEGLSRPGKFVIGAKKLQGSHADELVTILTSTLAPHGWTTSKFTEADWVTLTAPKPKAGSGGGGGGGPAVLAARGGATGALWYDGSDGRLVLGRRRLSFGPKLRAGDVVGVGRIYATGAAFFTLNGQWLGTASGPGVNGGAALGGLLKPLLALPAVAGDASSVLGAAAWRHGDFMFDPATAPFVAPLPPALLSERSLEVTVEGGGAPWVASFSFEVPATSARPEARAAAPKALSAGHSAAVSGTVSVYGPPPLPLKGPVPFAGLTSGHLLTLSAEGLDLKLALPPHARAGEPSVALGTATVGADKGYPAAAVVGGVACWRLDGSQHLAIAADAAGAYGAAATGGLRVSLRARIDRFAPCVLVTGAAPNGRGLSVRVEKAAAAGIFCVVAELTHADQSSTRVDTVLKASERGAWLSFEVSSAPVAAGHALALSVNG